MYRALGTVGGPVSIVHGRNDHLIPFTEAYRLHRRLSGAGVELTVTRLFGHSRGDGVPLRRLVLEVPRFARALDRILSLA